MGAVKPPRVSRNGNDGNPRLLLRLVLFLRLLDGGLLHLPPRDYEMVVLAVTAPRAKTQHHFVTTSL